MTDQTQPIIVEHIGGTGTPNDLLLQHLRIPTRIPVIHQIIRGGGASHFLHPVAIAIVRDDDLAVIDIRHVVQRVVLIGVASRIRGVAVRIVSVTVRHPVVRVEHRRLVGNSSNTGSSVGAIANGIKAIGNGGGASGASPAEGLAGQAVQVIVRPIIRAARATDRFRQRHPIFGGLGIDSTGARGRLNDLWKYSAGEWTWMSGAETADQKGDYGTKGAAAPSNVPGARVSASTWTDASGSLWLFGGFGYDSDGNLGILNDLWKYSGGEWTWITGSKVFNAFGRYGTLGTASTHNIPGARSNSVTWIDGTGNLWLFGGQGNDSNGALCRQSGGALPCNLNDLWKFNAGEWTWMGGAKVIAQPGSYGTLGKPGPHNVPGARTNALSWTDSAGAFWLFGGFGFASLSTTFGDLNDLWKFSDGEWTWVSGSSATDQPGRYGTEGTGTPRTVPGARDSSTGWIDTAGNLWLFGGGDYLSVAGGGKFNDLWKYSVAKTQESELSAAHDQ